jgi:hypothetical protein
MPYGALAYSEATVWLGWSANQPDPESATRQALAGCDRDDAQVLCCVEGCWLAFALSDATHAYGWSAKPNRDEAITSAIGTAASSGATDVRLVACVSTDTGEQFAAGVPKKEQGWSVYSVIPYARAALVLSGLAMLLAPAFGFLPWTPWLYVGIVCLGVGGVPVRVEGQQ